VNPLRLVKSIAPGDRQTLKRQLLTQPTIPAAAIALAVAIVGRVWVIAWLVPQAELWLGCGVAGEWRSR
jgi:hypothetical protein